MAYQLSNANSEMFRNDDVIANRNLFSEDLDHSDKIVKIKVGARGFGQTLVLGLIFYSFKKWFISCFQIEEITKKGRVLISKKDYERMGGRWLRVTVQQVLKGLTFRMGTAYRSRWASWTSQPRCTGSPGDCPSWRSSSRDCHRSQFGSPWVQ